MKKYLSYLLAAAFSVLAITSCDPTKKIEEEVKADKANIQASFERVNAMFDRAKGSVLFNLAVQPTQDTGYWYNYAGEGSGDYEWIEGEYIFVGEGNGEYAIDSSYFYFRHVGDGLGDYVYNGETGEHDYVGQGNGDYIKQYDYYEWVGRNNGAYDYEYGYYTYVGQGNGDYTKEFYDDGMYWGLSDFMNYTIDLAEKIDDSYGFMDDSWNTDGPYKFFDFAKHKGQYTYNNTAGTWSKSSSDVCRILFPESDRQANNNCELTLSEYTDKSVDLFGDNWYFPTRVKAYFKKDNNTLIDIDATADFNSNGVPITADATLYAKPFKTTVTFRTESTTRYSASVKIVDEDVAVNNLSVSGKVTLKNGISTWDDIDDNALNAITFTVTQEKLTIEGAVDPTAGTDDWDTELGFNRDWSLIVKYDGEEVGTLRAREVNDEMYLFIYYKDDTSENTSIYYNQLIKHLEELFSFDGKNSLIAKK